MKAAIGPWHFLLVGVTVLLSCWGLFWLDHETHRFSDLFTAENLAALLLYFIPTFFFCWVLLVLVKRQESRVALALGIGIPLGFGLVMLFLSYLMNRI